MSFWRTFGFQTVSQVDTILDKENFTLEELLDEEELLQESKSSNKKLADYLSKPDVLKRLIDFITVEPDENADAKRRSKYPFISSEVLCADIWAVYDAIFNNEALLDQLFLFLDKPLPLHPLLAQFVCKVAGVLLQKKSQECLAYLKKKGDAVLTPIIKNSDNPSVADLLIKIVGNEGAPAHGILQWFVEANLISHLVGRLNPTTDSDVHESAAQTLVDILVVWGSVKTPLSTQLESYEIISQLFENFLSPEATPSLICNALLVLMEMFKRTNSDNLSNLPIAPPTSRSSDENSLPILYTILVKNLERLNLLLQQPVNRNEVTFTYGTIVPLGVARLKIVEFVLCVIRTNHVAIHSELIRCNIISSCFDLFFTYVWNNFLHSTVDSMLTVIFEGHNNALKLAVLKECQLVERIVQANRENEQILTQPKGMRRGNMAFFSHISSLLINEGQKNEEISKILEAHEGWKNFVSTSLAKIQQLEASHGGHKPLSLEPTTSEEEEAEDFDKANPATLVFTQYLSQQGFGNVYPDECNDEEDYEDESADRFLEVDNEYDSPGLFSTDEKNIILEAGDGEPTGDGKDDGVDHSSSDEEADKPFKSENTAGAVLVQG